MFRFSKPIYFTLLSLFSLTISAQNKLIKGQVNNDNGTTITEAIIVVKNTTIQTVSDSLGQFSIEVPEGYNTLVLSKTGYRTQELETTDNVSATLILEDIMELSLEDLMNINVVSSSFFSLKSKDTPGYIFTQDMSKLHSPRTLSDMTRMILPGTSDGGHRETEIIGVRGMKVIDNSKTLVMVDGQSLNQRANLGYWNGFSTPLLGDIKTIEMGLSPNAIVHGSGAISGYINMIPKNGQDNAGLSASVTEGFVGDRVDRGTSKQIEMGYGWDLGQKKNIYVYGGWYNSQGYTPDSSLMLNNQTSFENNGYKYDLASHLDSTQVGNTFQPDFKVSTHVNWNNFSLNAGYQQIWHSTNLDMQNNFQRIFNVRPKYTGKINNFESVEVSFSSELFDYGNRKTDKNGAYSYGGNEGHYEGKFVAKSTRFDNNSLALGGLFGYREFNSQNQFFGSDLDFNSIQYIIDPATNKDTETVWATGIAPQGGWRETALFIEDIYTINEKLTVSGGLRYDNYYINKLKETQQNIAPRFAASYAFNNNSTLKLSYQQGFRTFDLFNLYQTMYNRMPKLNWANTDKNTNLTPVLPAGTNSTYDQYTIDIKPEKLNSFEVTYHQDLLNKQISIDINGFYNNYQNTIDYLPLVRWTGAEYKADKTYKGDVLYPGEYFTDEALQNLIVPSSKQSTRESQNKEQGMYLNVADDINIVGSEVIVNYRITDNTQFRAIYSYNRPLEASYRESSTSPAQQLKLSGTKYFFNDKIMLNALFTYEPGKDKTDSNSALFHDIYFSDRTLLDVTLAYQITDELSIKASGSNLLAENHPGILYKPIPSDINTNTSTEYLGLGKNERMYFVTLSLTL